MDRALPPLEEALTFEDRVAIEDVLGAAAAWAAGELPFYEAARVGTLRDWRGVPLPSWSRHVAIRVTPSTDPRRRNLMGLIDVLIAAQGFQITRQGIYSPDQIRIHDAGFDHTTVRPTVWHHERNAA